ncbi:MAG: hypothetical protein ACO3YY_12710 [Phycisphaerales bacterium]|jgi:hypothetical protein
MLRVRHLAAVAVIGLATPAAPADTPDTTAAATADRPSVVVTLADNMGFGDLGAFGSDGEIRDMPTPRIDGLASERLTLTQFSVEPGCTPSRAAYRDSLKEHPDPPAFGMTDFEDRPSTLGEASRCRSPLDSQRLVVSNPPCREST